MVLEEAPNFHVTRPTSLTTAKTKSQASGGLTNEGAVPISRSQACDAVGPVAATEMGVYVYLRRPPSSERLEEENIEQNPLVGCLPKYAAHMALASLSTSPIGRKFFHEPVFIDPTTGTVFKASFFCPWA